MLYNPDLSLFCTLLYYVSTRKSSTLIRNNNSETYYVLNERKREWKKNTASKTDTDMIGWYQIKASWEKKCESLSTLTCFPLSHKDLSGGKERRKNHCATDRINKRFLLKALT